MTRRVVIILALLVSLPFILAHFLAGTGHVFGGFLLNPADGNSYLAKMYEGWRGEWVFTLPYTAERSGGAYLFTFYLFLGHLARWLGAPLLWVFHLARWLCALFLAWMAWRFIDRLELAQPRKVFAFGLCCLGLGMGWLVFLFGVVTSDFWVAEAYPFLSSYVNPHFCLSLGLLLWLLIPFTGAVGQDRPAPRLSWKRSILVVLGGALLANMSPFAVVLALAIQGLCIAWGWLERRSGGAQDPAPLGPWLRDWALLLVGGLPALIYALAAVRLDPLLAAWNAQNLTPSPPAWDLLLAFSPALLLALPGAWSVLRSRLRSGRALLVWFLLAGVLIALPFGLQRRFLVGFYLPVAGLAAFGLESLAGRLQDRLKPVSITVMALSLPTTLLVLLLGQFGALTHDARLFLTTGEAGALEWIASQTAPDALVLAAPRTGMFIPAHTGRRVIYGHPFETVDAAAQEAAVTRFFEDAASQPAQAARFLQDRGVDYVFWGPSEQELGALDDLPGLVVAYNHAGVLIYRVARQ